MSPCRPLRCVTARETWCAGCHVCWSLSKIEASGTVSVTAGESVCKTLNYSSSSSLLSGGAAPLNHENNTSWRGWGQDSSPSFVWTPADTCCFWNTFPLHIYVEIPYKMCRAFCTRNHWLITDNQRLRDAIWMCLVRMRITVFLPQLFSYPATPSSAATQAAGSPKVDRGSPL
jgi:hypothetical protein